MNVVTVTGRALRRAPTAWLGVLCLVVVVVIAVGAHAFAGADPAAMVARPYLWPGQAPQHPLGTDMLGRDIWNGIVYGAQVSLRIGLQAGLLTAAVGLLIGRPGRLLRRLDRQRANALS